MNIPGMEFFHHYVIAGHILGILNVPADPYRYRVIRSTDGRQFTEWRVAGYVAGSQGLMLTIMEPGTVARRTIRSNLGPEPTLYLDAGLYILRDPPHTFTVEWLQGHEPS